MYVVGLGPGGPYEMTGRALEALEQSEVIVGYTVYVDLVRERFAHKELLATGMTKEVERCQLALQEALKGRTVAMVCSGDAGVYGMAGIMHEVAKDYPEVTIEVVPGITAACSAAAVLGAPLIHDFALISLSDLLTPWEKIEKRLVLAAEADFVICLYNPSSKKRHDYLQKACELMLRHKAKETACGYVRNSGRIGEEATVCTLEALKKVQVDMFTTVIIGNSETCVLNGKLVTPRGYQNRYEV